MTDNFKKQLLQVTVQLANAVNRHSDNDTENCDDIKNHITNAFFIIRKQIESKTGLSDSVISTPIGLRTYKAISSSMVTKHTNAPLDAYYDFKNYRMKDFSLKKLCNLFVHSYFLKIGIDKHENAIGIYYNSNDDKDDEIYHSSFKELIYFLCMIYEDEGASEVVSYQVEMDSKLKPSVQSENILLFKKDSVPSIDDPSFIDWMKKNLLTDYEDGDDIRVIKDFR